MLSLFLAWHIAWFARVILSVALFLAVITRKVYKQFPLFAVYSGWIAIAGTLLLVMNYTDAVSGNQYFAGVAASNGVETVLAFAIIYQMFAQTARRYPPVKGLGGFVFRAITLAFLAIAIALAWFAPARGPSQLTSMYFVIQRTLRTLQCGQLVFLFLFCGYFRLPWRGRAFGIALGLGILSSTSLAINAIHSQTVAKWDQTEYFLRLLSDLTYLTAISVWLKYLLMPEKVTPSTGGSLPPHDLGPWNRELERLLEP
jgi:hypothetical protein